VATSILRRRLQRFYPLDNGPQEIHALDGLRAIAALSVLTFHFFYIRGVYVGNLRTVVLGYNVAYVWQYLQSGVDLFFVLSGFLLFLPYARALLDARPLPSTRDFYRRRALRILPAYWVCLLVLVVVRLPSYVTKAGIKDVLIHVALVHNLFPIFNREIAGPFWTLAVEVQFYLLLPLIAWCIARVTNTTGSATRIILSILGMIIIALALREGAAFLVADSVHVHGWRAVVLNDVIVLVTGAQGRYLEVFALGMLCSVIYVVSVQRGLLSSAVVRMFGLALAGSSLVVSYLLAQLVTVRSDTMLGMAYYFMRPSDLEGIVGPILIGLGYALLLLGVLLSGGALAKLLSLAPLRFLGLISYSLYLWHLPLLIGALTDVPTVWSPSTRATLALAVGSFVAVGFAYASYTFVERPFLLRRHRVSVSSGSAVPAAPSAVGQGAVQPSREALPMRV
jgi:peptidoglycan/LPS O-acetylase OafA/YrhL